MELQQAGRLAERELLQAAEQHQILLEPEALKELASCGNANLIFEQAVSVMAQRGDFMLSHSLVADLISSLQTEKKTLPMALSREEFDVPAKHMEPNIRLFRDREVTLKSRCTGVLSDFVDHFRNRFQQMKVLLQSRRSEHPVVDRLNRVATYTNREKVRIIGMVYEKRESKNGHMLIQLEDESGALTCLAAKKSKSFEQSQKLLEDEVIAFDGFLSRELFIIDDIVWPDVPIRERKLSENDVCIGFLSDLHVGSKYFLQAQFHRFLEFLNGKGDESEREIAGKIKYLCIAGDLVDGIGVYPSQEKQLITKDVYAQYAALGEFIAMVPGHIHIIMAPGNHDAVRTAEPQPALYEEFAQQLTKKGNVHLVGNPAWFEIEGLKILMYHGTSLDSLIASMNMTDGYTHPEKTGIELLKRRHLSPSYGDKPLVPEHRDYMVIGEAPDIFHFGHVHKNGAAEYRGTLVVNSGTWQDTTDFQKRIGHVPSPCLFPVYNVSTGTLRVLDFRGLVE